MRDLGFTTVTGFLLFTALILMGLSAGPDPSQENSLAVWEGHDDAVTDVAFLPGGSTAVSSSLDGTIRLWDVERGQMQKVLYSSQDEIFSLSVSKDGSLLAATEYKGQVRIHGVNRKIDRHLTGLLGWTVDVAFSPDSDRVVGWNMDGDVWIWDARTGEQVGILKGQKNKWGMALTWSPDGTRVAAGRVVITLWDVDSQKQIRTLEGHEGFIRDLVFSPDGRYLASASMDKTVRVWELSTGETLYTLQPEGLVIYLKSGPVTNPIRLPVATVAFSPNGENLATGGADRVVRLWDAATGNLLNELKGHRMSITALAYSPDGTRLLSSSLDHTIRAWDIE